MRGGRRPPHSAALSVLRAAAKKAPAIKQLNRNQESSGGEASSCGDGNNWLITKNINDPIACAFGFD
jgi:hypothetical protein